MKQLNEQLKDSIEAKTGTRPEGYALHEILNSASGEENSTLVEAVADFIENLPSGGGATAPTFAETITWDGDTTGLESEEVEFGDTKLTYYKVSESALPFMYTDDGAIQYTCLDENDDAITPTIMAVDGFVVLGGAAISAYYNGYTSGILEGAIVPSAGTWLMKDGTSYCKSVTVAEAE